jgi:copper(I)-binding protein
MIRTAFLLALTAVISAVEISGAFARATAPGQGAAGVFMTVKNPRDQPVEITGASSSRAGRVELHRTETGADGVKRMVHQPSITIPAKGQVVLAPGGLHVMLLDLTAPLTEGSTIDVDVTLGDGTKVTTPVIVKWAGATEATAEKPSCCP